MSKAEQRAKEKYWLELNNIETQEKYAAYVDGYRQAEKDLALICGDIRELYIIFAEIDTEIEFGKIDVKEETMGYYQEALNRFNKLKEK